MAHSPGPWVIDQNSGPSIWIRQVNGPDTTLATAWGDIEDLEPLAFDNARLIAAAPDLLAALRTFTERYVVMINSGDCGNWDPETETEVIAARAAIAKAEG
jgi:hypothetical protein